MQFEFMFILILLLIGFFAGILSGLLGVGGGLIFTPILYYLFISNGVADPVTFTIATSLFCIILVSSSSSYKHIRQKNFNLNDSIYIALFGVVGTSIGKQITTSSYYSEREFTIVFTCILLYTAYSFLKNPSQKIETDLDEKKLHWWDGLFVGGIGGFVASLVGLGGGIVMVPFLTLIYKKPFYKTVSITSFAIVIISISAVIQFSLTNTSSIAISSYQLGYVDFGTAFPLAFAGIIGANRGAKWSASINKLYLKRVFAILALVEAGRLLVEYFF